LAITPDGNFAAFWVEQDDANDGDDVFAQRFTVSDDAPSIATATAGIYSTETSAFFLRNQNTAGGGDLNFPFGAPGQGYTPITGDWNGDGIDTIGIYSEATGGVFLRNSNSAGAADIVFQFGAAGPGYVPIAGDWDGNGTDTIGLYSPATGTFFLKNSNSGGAADIVLTFGAGGSTLLPLAGDWNGDGTDTVGVYQTAAGVFFLRDVNQAGPADVSVQYGPGGAGLLPITGSWDGDEDDTVGLYRVADGTFLLRNENSPGPAQVAPFSFGPGGSGIVPLAGDWNGPVAGLALAGSSPDEVISRLSQLGINLQNYLSSQGIDLRYVDLPGDQIIDVSGGDVLIDLEEASELLDSVAPHVLDQLENVDLTPVLDQLGLLFLTLEEIDLRRSEIDSIVDELLDSDPATPTAETLRRLSGR
jgi:hypothetical protein